MTGTVTAANNGLLVGTSTLFKSELEVGYWIYIAAKTECRKVTHILSDTELVLDQPFAAAVSGATPRLVARQPYRGISWLVDADGSAKIDGQTLEAGKSGSVSYMGGKRPIPVIIDSTTNGNEVFIEILY
jgi:hypothetical protein